MVFVVYKEAQLHIFNQVSLLYRVSIILSMDRKLILRILSSKSRIQLHLGTSGFVVGKLAVIRVFFEVLGF